jgi:hypothetical protein
VLAVLVGVLGSASGVLRPGSTATALGVAPGARADRALQGDGEVDEGGGEGGGPPLDGWLVGEPPRGARQPDSTAWVSQRGGAH